jgi:hypothetical protein
LKNVSPDIQTPSTPEGIEGIVGGSVGGVVVLLIIVVIISIVLCRKRNQKAEKKATYLTVISDNAAYNAAGDVRSGSDNSIEYLREEERSHQSNQYIGVNGSDEGSCHSPEGGQNTGKRV